MRESMFICVYLDKPEAEGGKPDILDIGYLCIHLWDTVIKDRKILEEMAIPAPLKVWD